MMPAYTALDMTILGLSGVRFDDANLNGERVKKLIGMTAWKGVALIAAFVLLQIAPLQQQTPGQPSGHHAKTQVKQEPLEPTIINNVDNHQGHDEREEKNPVATQDPDKWVRRGFWINLILTLITLAVAIAAVLQAKAALKQANHIAASERAWILVKTVGGPKGGWYDPENPSYAPGAAIEFAVYGNTPARLTDARLYLVNVPARIGTEPLEPILPEVPDYPKGPWNSEIPDNGRVLPPNDKFAVNIVLDPAVSTEDEFNKLWEWKNCVCLYGFVAYGDTFGVMHETRFCYVYEISRGGVIADAAGNRLNPDRFRIGGPKGYNQAT
jgi:hypothetical protein